MSLSVLPMFSCKSFIVSGLTFRSLTHFIFMYGVRKCSNFILLHLTGQFSQHHLLKRLSLPHYIFLTLLSKIQLILLKKTQKTKNKVKYVTQTAFIFFFFECKLVCFDWRLITLQCCVGFAIHKHNVLSVLDGLLHLIENKIYEEIVVNILIYTSGS